MDIKQLIILLNIPADLFQHIYLIGPLTKKKAAVGQGIIDWKEFFAAAKTGGVKNMFVEMAPDKFKDSATYIQKMYA
jgi:sugar phosphate isomerase/epimerase